MKSSKTFLCLFLILAVLSASLTGCASNMEDEFNPQNSQLAPGSDDSGVTGASEDSDVATTNEPYVAINEVYVAAKEAYAAVNEPNVADSEVYVPDSEPDVTDSEPDVPTSEPDVTDSEPDAPDNEVYVPTSEPDASDSEPDAPDSEVYVPESEPNVPDSEVYVPDSEPNAATSEPDAPTSKPYVPTSEPDVPKALATYEELNPYFPEPHASFAKPRVPVVYTSLDREKIDDNGYWKGVRALDFVELFDISAIHIPASVHTIDPAKVESAIISYLKETAPYELISDRPLADGDVFNIDYVGTVDGVEVERGSSTINLNNCVFIYGSPEQLLGRTPGKTYYITANYPYEVAQDRGLAPYSGVDIVYAEIINYIYRQIELELTDLTELTDAYIFENYFTINNWYSVAQMRAEFENYFKSDSIYDYIFDELIANTPVSSTPAAFAQYQTNAQILKESLVVQAIAEKADMVITSDELLTLHANYYDTAYYKIDWFGTEPYKAQQLLKYKVIDYLKEHAIYE